jgi:hypothetical protein
MASPFEHTPRRAPRPTPRDCYFPWQSGGREPPFARLRCTCRVRAHSTPASRRGPRAARRIPAHPEPVASARHPTTKPCLGPTSGRPSSPPAAARLVEPAWLLTSRMRRFATDHRPRSPAHAASDVHQHDARDARPVAKSGPMRSRRPWPPLRADRPVRPGPVAAVLDHVGAKTGERRMRPFVLHASTGTTSAVVAAPLGRNVGLAVELRGDNGGPTERPLGPRRS